MSLFRSIGVVFILNIADFILAPISNMIITKNLSVEQYGVMGFYNTIISFTTTVCSLGLGLFNYSMIPGRKEDEQYKYLGSTFLLQAIATIAGGLVVAFVMKDDFLKYGILCVFFVKLLVVIANNATIGFIGYQKRNITRAIANFLDVRLWMVPLIIWVLYRKLEVSNLLWIQALTGILVSGGCLFLINGKLLAKNLKLDREIVIRGIKFGLPLILVDLGQYLLDMGNRYVLKAFLTYTDIGYFNFATTLIMICFKFGMLIVYVLQPYIAESKNVGDVENYRKYVGIAIKYMYLLMILALIGMIANYSDIVLILGKKDYLVTKATAVVMSSYPIFMGLSYFLQILSALRGKVTKLPLIYLASVAVNVGLGILLVPRIGYIGAGISSLVGYLFLFALMRWFVGDPDHVIKMLISDLRVLLFIPALFAGLNFGAAALKINFGVIFLLNGVLIAALFFLNVVFTKDERAVLRKTS